MKSIRLLLLGMIAALAALAIGPASAVAAECKPETTIKFVLCVERSLGSGVTELLERTVGFLGSKQAGTTSELEVESPKTDVTCTEAEASGTLEPTTTIVLAMKVGITFKSGCHVVGEPAGCKVTEPITTAQLDGAPSLVNGAPNLLFKPESSTGFSTVHITGSECELKGTIDVEGEQLCATPNLEEELSEQLVLCEKSGSALKDGTKPVKFGLDELLDLRAPFEGVAWAIQGPSEARAWFVNANKLAAEEKLKQAVTLAKFTLVSGTPKAIVSCKKAELAAASAIRPELEMLLSAPVLEECTGTFNDPGCEIENGTITMKDMEGFLENNRFVKLEPTGAAETLFVFKVVEGAEECNEQGEWRVKKRLLAKLREPENEIKMRKLALERAANAITVVNPGSMEGTGSLEAEVEGIEVASGNNWSAKKP